MRNIFFILFSLSSFLSFAQYRMDRIWNVGYASWSGDPGFGITQMTFAEDTMMMEWKNMPINFSSTGITISDENTGEPLFCTNAFVVLDKNNDTMQNGYGFSPCSYQDQFIEWGHKGPQAALIIPFPQKHQYFMFHNTMKIGASLTYDSKLEYSIIDMSLNQGAGSVIQKNTLVIADTLYSSTLTAVQHANGRDWWVIQSRVNSEAYWKILVTPNGITKIDSQNIGSRLKYCSGSNMKFSKSGEKFIKYDAFYKRFQIMDFDRCKGDFSNYRSCYLDTTNYEDVGGGAEFSPNESFLYVSTANKMYQYNLEAVDIQGSGVLIDTFDGFASPFGAYFYLAQLAPDGKIYWSCGNGENVMHVIHHPDSAGLACGFEQHGVQLLSYNAFTMPHYPNYYLGALVGSGCDTVTTSVGSGFVQPTAGVYVYPNPASSKAKFVFALPLEHARPIFVYNSLGQKVAEYRLEEGAQELIFAIDTYSQGVYYYYSEGLQGKFIVEK